MFCCYNISCVAQKVYLFDHRFNPKTSRGGLRSGGDLPPGSDAGLKTERKIRTIPKVKVRSPIKSKCFVMFILSQIVIKI